MSLLARAERHAFSQETADALRGAGFTLGIASTAGLLALVMLGGFQPWLALFAIVVFLPALLLLALSRTLPARRPVSVWLIWLLCGFAVMLVRVTPRAAEGLEPQWLLRPALQGLAVIELAFVVLVAWFAWHLFRKGAFTGEARR